MDSSAGGFLKRILPLAEHADAVILLGSSGFHQKYIELIAAGAIKARSRGRGPVVILHDTTWDVSSQALERRHPAMASIIPKLGQLAIRAIDGPHVIYCVLSTEEKRSFAARWHVDDERVRFVPFGATLSADLASEATDGGYIFSGGDSYRDYDLLAEAVQDLDVLVQVASSSWKPERELPSNVKLLGWIPKAEFDRHLLDATIVVTTLRQAPRCAGLNSYINAMLFGKVVIVTEAPGVRDYVDDGETGLVVDPEPAAVRRAIEWALAPENQAAVARMRAKAQEVAKDRFLLRHYFARLWEIAEQEVAARGGGATRGGPG
jgi:glycosyltransferase involved in cell wall biosynthesis